MNHRLLAALAAGTLLASGAAALAQASTAPPPPPPPAGNPFFDEMDANKDGVVTRAEIGAVLDKKFAALDTDHNGTISQAERQAHRQAERDKRFNERFAAMDTDHNGQLSPAELRAAHDGRDGPGPYKGGRGFGGPGFGGRGHDGPGGPGGPGPHRDGGPDGAPKAGDPKDGGDMTKAEFSKRALTMFDLLDSNDDGKITAAERDAAPSGHRGFPGHGGGRYGDMPKS